MTRADQRDDMRRNWVRVLHGGPVQSAANPAKQFVAPTNVQNKTQINMQDYDFHSVEYFKRTGILLFKKEMSP